MEQSKLFKEYQERLMTILSFFDKLCRDNGIKYTVLDGTLLGAVRHQGMIPWDGDVDVALTPKEFEKLKCVFEKEESRYYLNYLPNHFFRGNNRKHDFKDLTAKIIDKKCNNSIFGIDVFTIDFLGDDLNEALKTVKLYKRFYNMARLSLSFHIPDGKITIKKIIAIVAYPILKLISILFTPYFLNRYLKFRADRIDNMAESSKYFTIEPYVGRFNVEHNDILDGGYIDMPFGDFKVMCVKNYDSYLKPTYGDYMKLPPIEKRIPYPSEEELISCVFED